jgi:hypothetical protein
MRLKGDVSADSLIRNLRQYEQRLANAHEQPGRVQWYAGMVDTIEETLRHFLDDTGLADGLFTYRYWHILQGSVPDSLYGKGVFRQECAYQAGRLKRACEELEALREHAQGEGTVAVPDTNVLVHCGTVRDIDWRAQIGGSRVRVVIPLVVVDELDELKWTARERADRTAVRKGIRVLKDALAGHPPGAAALLAEGVTVAVLPDPRGHRRLPSNDEEICERAAMLRQFTSPVVLATNDNGMHVRALGYSVDTIEIPEKDTPG